MKTNGQAGIPAPRKPHAALSAFLLIGFVSGAFWPATRRAMAGNIPLSETRGVAWRPSFQPARMQYFLNIQTNLLNSWESSTTSFSEKFLTDEMDFDAFRRLSPTRPKDLLAFGPLERCVQEHEGLGGEARMRKALTAARLMVKNEFALREQQIARGVVDGEFSVETLRDACKNMTQWAKEFSFYGADVVSESVANVKSMLAAAQAEGRIEDAVRVALKSLPETLAEMELSDGEPPSVFAQGLGSEEGQSREKLRRSGARRPGSGHALRSVPAPERFTEPH